MINTSLHEYQICDPSETGKPDIRPALSQYRSDEKQDDVYKELYIPSSVFQQISFRILTLPMIKLDTRIVLVMFIPGLPACIVTCRLTIVVTSVRSYSTHAAGMPVTARDVHKRL